MLLPILISDLLTELVPNHSLSKILKLWNFLIAIQEWPISLTGGSSEPFQGSWSYLGPLWITPGAVAHFQVAWAA